MRPVTAALLWNMKIFQRNQNVNLLRIYQSVNSKNSVEANMQQYAKGAPNHCCYDDNSESGGEFQGM